MDAIRLKEWRIFIFLSDMREEMAYLVFTAIHVPMYILFFWGLFGAASDINRNLIIGSNLFFIVHVLLHLLFFKHPHYQFKSVFSWGLILGCGLCGAIDLLASF
ncbi:MAG: hypothetical protein HC828_14445 [Blastochloris sp.]|nr:hypothetical protein [Blastochloris sp.]